MQIVRVVLVVLAVLLQARGAEAQSCNFTISNMNFGNVDLLGGLSADATATFTASCTGVKNRTVRVCPNIGSGTGNNNSTASIRYLLNGTNSLNYNLYHEASAATVWGSYVWPWTPRPPTIDIALNTSGSGNASQTVYGRIFSGQSTAIPGTYTSVFSGGHTLISYAYSTVGNCATIAGTNGKQVSFTVSATPAASCQVTPTALNFGSAGILSAVVDATNTIGVKCTNGTPYVVGLNNGTSGATNPVQRLMRNLTNGKSVMYGIYRDVSRLLPWGSTTGTNTFSSTGTGATQNLTGYGRVPIQTSPPAATYSDTIVVTVTY